MQRAVSLEGIREVIVRNREGSRHLYLIYAHGPFVKIEESEEYDFDSIVSAFEDAMGKLESPNVRW